MDPATLGRAPIFGPLAMGFRSDGVAPALDEPPSPGPRRTCLPRALPPMGCRVELPPNPLRDIVAWLTAGARYAVLCGRRKLQPGGVAATVEASLDQLLPRRPPPH